MEDFEGSESKFGRIFKVAGPRKPLSLLTALLVVVAEKMSGSKMYELVKVGWDKLVGEIIKLESDTASIQCYEDTCTLFLFLTHYSWTHCRRPSLQDRKAFVGGAWTW